MDHIRRVRQVALEETRKSDKAGSLVFLILLDVKNAFNAISWIIMNILQRKRILPFLKEILKTNPSLAGYLASLSFRRDRLLDWLCRTSAMLELLYMQAEVERTTHADNLVLLRKVHTQFHFKNIATVAVAWSKTEYKITTTFSPTVRTAKTIDHSF